MCPASKEWDFFFFFFHNILRSERKGAAAQGYNLTITSRSDAATQRL
jgi:hypothetical protein